MLCLQKSLNPYVTNINIHKKDACSALKDFAFSTHSECYVDSGVCELSCSDIKAVFAIIENSLLTDLVPTIKQVIETADACLNKRNEQKCCGKDPSCYCERLGFVGKYTNPCPSPPSPPPPPPKPHRKPPPRRRPPPRRKPPPHRQPPPCEYRVCPINGQHCDCKYAQCCCHYIFGILIGCECGTCSSYATIFSSKYEYRVTPK